MAEKYNFSSFSQTNLVSNATSMQTQQDDVVKT